MSQVGIEQLPIDYVEVPASMPPQLFVVVDTEEEFDWSAPFSRDNTSVSAMRHIHRLQSILDRHRIRPTYVIDYAVSHQRDGYAPLKEIADSGRCRIGAHLHPWVTPPHAEEINRRHSFACTLGTLEAEKIRILRDDIADRFGKVPATYKAGRYGFGPSTAEALEALGFDIDLSVNPRNDYTNEGGPSFVGFDTTPFFFGRRRRLLELPCSTDFSGALAGSLGPVLHRAASTPALRRLHAVGVMARLHVVNKTMLSPEGHSLAEMQALTRSLLARGVRTFAMTLHSPSVQPGCTPYVRTERDLQEFLARIDAFCGFFLGEVGGASTTPEDLYGLLSKNVSALEERAS